MLPSAASLSAALLLMTSGASAFVFPPGLEWLDGLSRAAASLSSAKDIRAASREPILGIRVQRRDELLSLSVHSAGAARDTLGAGNRVHALKRRGLDSLLCCSAMPKVEGAAHKWEEVVHEHTQHPHVTVPIKTTSSTFRPVPKEWEGVAHVNHPYIIPTQREPPVVKLHEMGARVGGYPEHDVRLEHGEGHHDWHIKQQHTEDMYGELHLSGYEVTKVRHGSRHQPMPKLPLGPLGGKMELVPQVRTGRERPELPRERGFSVMRVDPDQKTWTRDTAPNDRKKKPSPDLHLRFNAPAPIHFREVELTPHEVTGQPTFKTVRQAHWPPLPEKEAEHSGAR